MNKRPTSMSVIGALFLIFGLWALYGVAVGAGSPAFEAAAAQSRLGVEAILAMNVIGGLVTAASGYGVLQGLNWSRYLWTGWSIIGLLIGLFTAPISWLALATAAYISAFAYFLFRQQANAWFDKSGRA